MNKRYIGAAMIAPALVFFLIGGVILKYFVLVLALCGLYEFYNACKKSQLKPISIIGYIITLVYFVTLGESFNFEMVSYMLVLGTFITMFVPVFNTEYNFIDVATTMFGILYVTIFFSLLPLINMLEYGQYLIWLVFISSWGCDTLAYYTGRSLGKHKLVPKVSPKKTVEGAIGGLFGSVLGCVIYGYVIKKFGVNISLYNYAIIGILGGIVGQLGDFVASSIKRHAKIKDYSNLIPGHGGILDRFDSILFVSVVVYYYITIFMGM
ncbi:phosphatidate cytidylyltransferase [Clostridium sp. ATCC 25772]|uniref:phosphatidate cytidylyltransferase n=1 Tax=Clostridium sp. ATCC 25772 TaxID=1676991 RepID=UPI000785CE2F|nr:phosphatidate cytidylyltransferase [Clostridium sp. ATCC 25772]